jgi:hypothetical protein
MPIAYCDLPDLSTNLDILDASQALKHYSDKVEFGPIRRTQSIDNVRGQCDAVKAAGSGYDKELMYLWSSTPPIEIWTLHI